MTTLLLALTLLSVSPQPLPGTLAFVDATKARVALDEPGMLYLVDVWALGCKPCIEEIPELERLRKKYEATGKFKLVSVLWGGWAPEELPKLAKEAGIEHGLYTDPENWIERLDAKSFPTKLLIKDGLVLRRVRGGGRGAYHKWNEIVGKQLAPPVP